MWNGGNPTKPSHFRGDFGGGGGVPGLREICRRAPYAPGDVVSLRLPDGREMRRVVREIRPVDLGEAGGEVARLVGYVEEAWPVGEVSPAAMLYMDWHVAHPGHTHAWLVTWEEVEG